MNNIMKQLKFTHLAVLTLLALVTACNDDYPGGYGPENGSGRLITLTGEIEQIAATRVNDNGFCDGDEMSVYIVDYTPEIV